MNVPTSTAGLSPTRRCQDLARRAMICKRYPLLPTWEQRWENLVEAVHHPGRGFDSIGGWCNNEGTVSVSQLGGGYHRDSTLREYRLRGNHVIFIGRSKE